MLQSILFITLLLGRASAAEVAYSLADLEVLSQEGAFTEFFVHAMDIRPSERQETWKNMVTKMADAATRTILNKAEIEKKDFNWIENHYRWPVLKNDDVFKLKRQDIGLRYLNACLKKEVPCWDDVKMFWEADLQNPETSFKLAEMVVQYKNSPYTTWTFLEVPLKNPLSEFYCKKDFVMDSLWGKLEIDYIRLGSKGDFLTKIDQTLHHDCLPSLNAEANKRLYSPVKVGDRELAYQILNSQGKMDQKTEDFFLTVYLLEKPSQGELFNYSWNRVKQLAQAPSRRDKVLTMLKNLDPLPDELFMSLDQQKKRVILQLFKTHFPEYITFYSHQCVQFYGGKSAFPQGNPTVHCQDFMNSELAPQFIDADQIKLFQDARKI